MSVIPPVNTTEETLAAIGIIGPSTMLVSTIPWAAKPATVRCIMHRVLHGQQCLQCWMSIALRLRCTESQRAAVVPPELSSNISSVSHQWRVAEQFADEAACRLQYSVQR